MKKRKHSWVNTICKVAGLEKFDWQLIAEKLKDMIELEEETMQELAKDDREIDAIRHCLTVRNEANDKLLMRTIGIQSMLNFRNG